MSVQYNARGTSSRRFLQGRTRTHATPHGRQERLVDPLSTLGNNAVQPPRLVDDMSHFKLVQDLDAHQKMSHLSEILRRSKISDSANDRDRDGDVSMGTGRERDSKCGVRSLNLSRVAPPPEEDDDEMAVEHASQAASFVLGDERCYELGKCIDQRRCLASGSQHTKTLKVETLPPQQLKQKLKRGLKSRCVFRCQHGPLESVMRRCSSERRLWSRTHYNSADACEIQIDEKQNDVRKKQCGDVFRIFNHESSCILILPDTLCVILNGQRQHTMTACGGLMPEG